jgi:hypothetical protein
MMYALGDFCREYARCRIINGQCSLSQDLTFEMCATCVRQCTDAHLDDPIESFNCEARCRDQLTAMLDAAQKETKGAEMVPGQIDGAYSVDEGENFENVEEGNFGAPSELTE